MRVSIAALSISAAGAFSTSRNTLAAPRRPAASSSQLQMLDAAVIQGGAAAVGGLAVGLGMAWFSEQQVEQGEQRGSGVFVSEATRAKMSAMFMEDEVLPDTTLDDTVSRMEAALAAAKGEAAVEEKVEEKPASSIDDGWWRVLASVCFFAWRRYARCRSLARCCGARKTRQLTGRAAAVALHSAPEAPLS